jgi:hypothetical protein
MRKLKLTVEELEVTSFTVHDVQQGRGTVDGHLRKVETVDDPTCNAAWATCNEEYTCAFATCGGTCYASCEGVCGSGNTTCAVCLLY